MFSQEGDYGHDLEEDEIVESLRKLPTLEPILMASPTRSQRSKSQTKKSPEGSKDEDGEEGQEEDEERRAERKRGRASKEHTYKRGAKEAEGHTSRGNKNEPDSKGAAQ